MFVKLIVKNFFKWLIKVTLSFCNELVSIPNKHEAILSSVYWPLILLGQSRKDDIFAGKHTVCNWRSRVCRRIPSGACCNYHSPHSSSRTSRRRRLDRFKRGARPWQLSVLPWKTSVRQYFEHFSRHRLWELWARDPKDRWYRRRSMANRSGEWRERPEFLMCTRRLINRWESLIRIFRRRSGSERRISGAVPS